MIDSREDVLIDEIIRLDRSRRLGWWLYYRAAGQEPPTPPYDTLDENLVIEVANVVGGTISLATARRWLDRLDPDTLYVAMKVALMRVGYHDAFLYFCGIVRNSIDALEAGSTLDEIRASVARSWQWASQP